MIADSYDEVRQKLSSFLDNAQKEGEMLTKRRGGPYFTIRPINASESPLEIGSVNLKLSSDEIVSSIREIEKR
jgi:hypothetical protein